MSTAADVASLAHETFRREFFLLPGMIQGTEIRDEGRRKVVRRWLAALTASWYRYCDALDAALAETDVASPTAALGAHLETQSVMLHARLNAANVSAAEWTTSIQSRSRLAAEMAGIAESVREYLADQTPLIEFGSRLRVPDDTWATIVRATLSVDHAGLFDAVLGGGQRAQDQLMMAMTNDRTRPRRHPADDIRRLRPPLTQRSPDTMARLPAP